MIDVTIVVVEDHPIFRQGVIDTLSLEPDFSIVGQAADGDKAIQLIRARRPRVAVIDVNIPGINGQQVTRQVVSEKLPTRVVLFTAYDDDDQKISAMRGGAAAYCVKDVEPETLVWVIRQVVAGKYVVGSDVFSSASLDHWITYHTEGAVKSYSDPGDPFQPLSGREMEVLTYLTRGLSNKEIASSLKISHQTVKNHVTAILRKLGVEDRTQAAIYAIRRGWVRLHEQNEPTQE
jgi:DNA-binding NarL/FixJ family response regulator